MPGAIDGDAVTLLIDLAVRSSVLLALGLLLSACLAKRSAALRHRVLAAALLAAALVIPVSLAFPEWNVTLPARIFGSLAEATLARPGQTPAAPLSTRQYSAAPNGTTQH